MKEVMLDSLKFNNKKQAKSFSIGVLLSQWPSILRLVSLTFQFLHLNYFAFV